LIPQFKTSESFFSDCINSAKTKALKFVSSIINKVKTLPQNIWNSIAGAISKISEWWNQLSERAKFAAANI
jgi:phage-related protein